MNTIVRTNQEMPPADASRESWISKTPGVCGGDACIRSTRIPVWLLVEERRLGVTDDEILEAHPALSAADLRESWKYSEAHSDEIDQAIQENEDA